MFESVARDFSDFGAQVFAFDVMNALNRKGGDLVSPSMDDEIKKRSQKKNRGRKNKYYKQIDDEDDQEANHQSESDNDLDGIREEEDEDEDEVNRKRMEIEAARQEAKKKE